jgi:hypothetical protein
MYYVDIDSKMEGVLIFRIKIFIFGLDLIMCLYHICKHTAGRIEFL